MGAGKGKNKRVATDSISRLEWKQVAKSNYVTMDFRFQIIYVPMDGTWDILEDDKIVANRDSKHQAFECVEKIFGKENSLYTPAKAVIDPSSDEDDLIF